jgi:hypothetical protein
VDNFTAKHITSTYSTDFEIVKALHFAYNDLLLSKIISSIKVIPPKQIEVDTFRLSQLCHLAHTVNQPRF